MTNHQDKQQELELYEDKDDRETKEEKLARERETILKNISSIRLDTLTSRTAWILNHYPDARDSDIELQLKFWEHFDSDIYNGSPITPEDYKKLTRLDSLHRVRAKIQNGYKLFQASDAVKKYRGKLEEKERENAVSEKRYSQGFSVYADESGKNQDHLIVGSVWFLDGHDTFDLMRQLIVWKDNNNFHEELHFTEISKRKLPCYKEVVDLFIRNSHLVSFKAISVRKEGLSNKMDAFVKLFYYLLKRGVEHENITGRALLPRGLSLCKDEEEKGYDEMLLGEVTDKLQNISKSTFDGELYLETFRADNSKENGFLQIADLFTGSINRVLNHEGEATHAKDEFARYFLDLLGVDDTLPSEEQIGDITVLLKI